MILKRNSWKNSFQLINSLPTGRCYDWVLKERFSEAEKTGRGSLIYKNAFRNCGIRMYIRVKLWIFWIFHHLQYIISSLILRIWGNHCAQNQYWTLVISLKRNMILSWKSMHELRNFSCFFQKSLAVIRDWCAICKSRLNVCKEEAIFEFNLF